MGRRCQSWWFREVAVSEKSRLSEELGATVVRCKDAEEAKHGALDKLQQAVTALSEVKQVPPFPISQSHNNKAPRRCWPFCCHKSAATPLPSTKTNYLVGCPEAGLAEIGWGLKCWSGPQLKAEWEVEHTLRLQLENEWDFFFVGAVASFARLGWDVFCVWTTAARSADLGPLPSLVCYPPNAYFFFDRGGFRLILPVAPVSACTWICPLIDTAAFFYR